MSKSLLAVFASVIMSGCVGLDIKSLTPDQVKNAHSGAGDALEGYVVYHPMIIFPVENKMVCEDEKSNGDCDSPNKICSIGALNTVPDYSRPYLVKSRPGFGKSGVEIQIDDGWRLGKIKDESDNAAVLSDILDMVPSKEKDSFSGGLCDRPGLYKMDYTEGETKPVLLKEY
jgi:hypothetical protein